MRVPHISLLRCGFQRIPKILSRPQPSQKPPKIFTSNTIKNLKTWRSERGQFDKLRIEIKRKHTGGASRLFYWRILPGEYMLPEQETALEVAITSGPWEKCLTPPQ